MFKEYYRLTGPPFQLTPDHSFFFRSSIHMKATSYLLYGLMQGEGFIVITGDVGAGKTTLLQNVLVGLDKNKYVFGQIVTSRLGAVDMLRMVAQAFALPSHGNKAALLTAIRQFLVASFRNGRRCLLFIDEVQNLPVPALEELRMLSNFQVDNQAPMQSFLVGQPQFRSTLASPELEQLRQRVIAATHLGPLSASETRGYIEHRLRLVGWTGDPDFTEECTDAMHRHSRGIPRRINALASRLLVFGFLEEVHQFTAAMTDSVAEELLEETEPNEDALDFSATHLIEGPGTGATQWKQLRSQVARHSTVLKRMIQLLAARPD